MVRIVLTHGRGLHGRTERYLHDKFVGHFRAGLDAAGYGHLDRHDVRFLYYGNALVVPAGAGSAAPAGTEVLAPTAPVAETEAPSLTLLAADAQAETTAPRRLPFEDAAASLAGRLTDACVRDPRIGDLARGCEDDGVADDADPVEAAIDRRSARLLADPDDLRSVLTDRFGAEVGDDAIRRELTALGDLVAAPPPDEDDGPFDALRERVIEPALDAVASLRVLIEVARDHGVDLRDRLTDWQRARVAEALERLAETDLARPWAAAFDVISAIAHASMLDGLYIMHRMRDVHDYFHVRDTRDAVRGMFRDAVAAGEGPVIVVAHSLGSVIAYDAMRADPDLAIDGLVSVGSPLSVGAIRRRLARMGESADALPVPPRLGRWENVYSELDPITLGAGIQRSFAGGGDRGPVDRQAENTGYVASHSPDQYLRSRATAAAVIAMLARSTGAVPAGVPTGLSEAASS